MANYKIVDANQLDADLTSVADSIRTKGGTTAVLAFPEGFKTAIAAIETGGSGGGAAILPLSITMNGVYTAPAGVDGYSPVTVNVAGGGGIIPTVKKKEVNFIDYDGAILYSYTVAEATALAELPPLPERAGLICQGWNSSLSNVKSYAAEFGGCEVGATYITDDGKTRIYITLPPGRTSPMLGCCPRGTVTVDWGDGTGPDVLTGTSTSSVKWTPNHEYAAPGDYVIKLTVDGEMSLTGTSTTNQGASILRHSSGTDTINRTYQLAVKKIEGGAGVVSILSHAFRECSALASLTLPASVKTVGTNAFYNCSALVALVLPSGATVSGTNCFYCCYSLTAISIPDGAVSIQNYTFQNCRSLTSVTIPGSVTSIGSTAFQHCYGLSAVTIPHGVTSVGSSAFQHCYGLSAVIFLGSVASIAANAFSATYGIRYFDFTSHTAVPALANTSAFTGIAADCEIRVPAALYDEWIAATNWSTYASNIVGV